MSTEREYYVYTLAYPESMGGHVFYIGKGMRLSENSRGIDRIDDHERRAKRGDYGFRYDVIREIWRNGEQIVKRKICENIFDIEALMYETALIMLMSGYGHLANAVRTSIPCSTFRIFAEFLWVWPEGNRLL